MKKWLKSVYIYGSYRKIKTGVSLFLDHSVYLIAQRTHSGACSYWIGYISCVNLFCFLYIMSACSLGVPGEFAECVLPDD